MEFSDRQMIPGMGGAVADFIQKSVWKTIPCLGVCFSEVEITPESIRGYPHSGGLPDAQGRKWWVYIECYNLLKSGDRHCRYGISFPKVIHRLSKMKGDQ